MKPIPGFPNYAITKDGRIWSNRRQGSRGQWLHPQAKKEYGHLRILLRKNGKYLLRQVHRLVLETFIGPCPAGKECRHLDGNPKNNNLDNLCWGTHKENFQDMIRHGTDTIRHLDHQGEHNGNAKLDKTKVKVIRFLRKYAGFLVKDLALQFGVERHTISAICSGKRWYG